MDWAALRQSEFPVTRHWAYFDHAAVAPLSARAQQALSQWASDLAENGDVHEPQWVARVEQVRQSFAQLLNADPQDLAFVKNTSEGLGIVAEGFPWQPGDNVVTAAEEYPANIYPWMNLTGRGVELRLVPSRGARVVVDDVRQAIDGRTRILTVSHVEFASGFRNDLNALGALCRERGILFCVDAIQGLGIFPVDVGATPIDFLAADGHKWLLGPEGAAVFYIRGELVDRLHPVGVGWNSVVGSRNFSRIDFRLKPGAGRWESGSLNVAGIVAVGASLELLLNIGVPAIRDRVLHLTDYLCEQAARKGLTVYSSRQPGEDSSIVSLIVPGAEPRPLVRACREAGMVVNHRAGRIRASPHCYNTEQEIDRLVEQLAPSGKPVAE
jgi:cysteine desulfurase / selenocysteine lyase